jgi:hypothetical protein
MYSRLRPWWREETACGEQDLWQVDCDAFIKDSCGFVAATPAARFVDYSTRGVP